MSSKRDLEFLYEIGAFRFISRTWRQFLNADFANDAEHTFRVAWIALLLAEMEGVGNHEKILKMALVHDLPESRTGDVNYLTRQYTERDESQAIKDIFANTKLEAEMVALWHEYEDRSSIEAKLVKDADNLDVDFELVEQAARGETHRAAFATTREVVHRTQLSTAAARGLWRALQKSNPHDWYLNGISRLWGGKRTKLNKEPLAAHIGRSKKPRSR